MQKLLYSVAKYLLQKSLFERFVFLLLFLGLYFVALRFLENGEWASLQRSHANSLNIQYDVMELFKQYDIKSKCLKAICTNKELHDSKNLAREKNTQYALYFTCKDFACYEFIRAFENLPTVFIYKIKSSNITFIDNYDEKEKGLSNSFQLVKTDEQEPVKQWLQDIEIYFSIEKIGE